jgi:hypothetical protein
MLYLTDWLIVVPLAAAFALHLLLSCLAVRGMRRR